MRYSAIYDDEFAVGGGEAKTYGPRVESTAEAEAPNDPPAGPAPDASPAPVETPVNTPGPSQAPQGNQGGPPEPTNPPGPPALATGQGAGLQGSDVTGGLQGTFDQAGTAKFAQKFGGINPAVWFRNFVREGAPGLQGSIPGQSSRAATTRGGGASGGAIPTVSAVAQGPEGGMEGGGTQDEEWQRFMRAVLQSRFGRG
jgi:hypothetical protein